MNTKVVLSGLVLASVFMSGAALAQETSATAHFTLSVHQPTLFDEGAKDTFSGSIDDNTGVTTFSMICSAGASGFIGIGRVDETCATAGNGTIRNPNNLQQQINRVNYSGGFVIQAKQDGYTDVSSIKAAYQRVGGAASEDSSFEGSLIMMPENPSASANELADALFSKIKEKATGVDAVEFDTQIDSITFTDLTVPHVGQMTTTSCEWNGPAIFAYANNSWQMDFDVTCGEESYQLEGNMALVDAPVGSDHDQEYQINLVVPGVGGGDPFAAADPFATVPGITGTLEFVNSGRSADDVYERVEVSGDLVGNGLPTEVVRGYGQIMLVFARTFFGA